MIRVEKIIWRSFLLTIILVQCSWSRPVSERDMNHLSFVKNKDVCLKKIKYDQLEVSDSAGSPRASLELLKFTLNAFQNLALDSAQKAKEISENILKHADILSAQSPKVLEFKKNLTQFVEKYSLCNDLVDLFELVEIFSNTTEYYLESDEDTLNANDRFIADLLQKYGSEDLEYKAWNDMKEFVPKFRQKFVYLKQDLSKEEGEVGQKLQQWFKRFETLSNNEEEIESFVDFFALFDDADE